MSTATKSIADAGGAALADLVFPDGPCGITATLDAGTGVLQVSCDPEEVIRANPADASLRWAQIAALSGVAPAFHEVNTSVTAVRVLPSGGNAELRVSW